jgi:hypothetical protein
MVIRPSDGHSVSAMVFCGLAVFSGPEDLKNNATIVVPQTRRAAARAAAWLRVGVALSRARRPTATARVDHGVRAVLGDNAAAIPNCACPAGVRLGAVRLLLLLNEDSSFHARGAARTIEPFRNAMLLKRSGSRDARAFKVSK